MAVTLRKYLNSKLKEKGLTVKEAKKNAGKYKSIAAAKKAGSLYYTNKDGKVMAAVYAEDLKKPLKPKARPDSGTITVTVLAPAFTIPTKGAQAKRSIGEREATSKQVSKVKKIAEKGLAKATKFDEWYKKNKDKYKNRARAMEAYKMGPGKTEHTRYGKSKGGLTKSSGILNTGIAKPENTYK
tara:strand:+ start:214 stop:765 length:552 start_codon:yes stop_codon:yes gene_type:complete